MTLPQACDHSLAQLKLLMQAAQRRQAETGLMHMQTTLAAVAACWSKDGQRVLDKVRAALMKQLE